MPDTSNIETLTVGTGEAARDIVVRKRSGQMPGIVWLGGYRSDMLGTKAEALDEWAMQNGRACCRHDYSGHGESGGNFEDGTISRWTEESLAVFDHFCAEGSHLLVGSSMGAWVAIRMVQCLNERGDANRLQGLLLLAPAPDFTEELMRPELTSKQLLEIEEKGFLEEASEYSNEPNIYTKALFDDGQDNLVMTDPINTGCPVHIIQGMQDPDVPYQHALKLTEYLPDDNVLMTLVKDGDHRLSRPQDIELILRAVSEMCR